MGYTVNGSTLVRWAYTMLKYTVIYTDKDGGVICHQQLDKDTEVQRLVNRKTFPHRVANIIVKENKHG